MNAAVRLEPKHALRTSALWPRRMATHDPSSGRHTLAVLSAEALTSRDP
eukprot:CAMPEP_0185910510 /NCGR_PEP_ID=MMETSP0196C-20130402/19939_1 /TAXON_ID=2932 /ORGANISM="Alexandrium fundyense, Strain CCMP1719" /LENGTH=48 /DNA_ID= /DNA_START= /DNA_END= /DNA_ORIENTATION=